MAPVVAATTWAAARTLLSDALAKFMSVASLSSIAQGPAELFRFFDLESTEDHEGLFGLCPGTVPTLPRVRPSLPILPIFSKIPVMKRFSLRGVVVGSI